MTEEQLLSRRFRSVEKPSTGAQYTAKDFQLEVLDKLAEVQRLAGSLEISWNNKLAAAKEQRLVKFDSRTLIALGRLHFLSPGT